MKTKKSIILAAATILVATLCFSGCEKVAAHLAYFPNFALADTLYNGQELKIQRIRIYTYDFESNSPYVTLTNRSGKNWYATFNFDETKCSGPFVVTITAHNLDQTVDEDGEPVDYKMSQKCTLFDWKLTWVEVPEEDEEHAGSTCIRMTGIGTNEEFFVAETSDRIYTSWKSVGKLTWEAEDNLTIVSRGNCDCYVKKVDESKPARISARLNDKKRSLTF